MADDKREVVVPVDVVAEQVVLAAACAGWDAGGAQLLDRLQPDVFSDEKHRALWGALREMRQRRLAFDHATVHRVAGDPAAARYLESLCEGRPDWPDDAEYHVGNLLWDRQRVLLAEGPLQELLTALRDQTAPPDRVRALCRSISQSVEGTSGSAQHLHDPRELVRTQMGEINKRVQGLAVHPFGIPGLDRDLDKGTRRLIAGAHPGMVTVVTGISGGGKSTLTGHLTLGLARQGKRILYGAWEMSGGMMLMLLACLSLGWSRSVLMEGAREVGTDGDGFPVYEPLVSPGQLVELEERMHAIGERVTFMRNPFRRGRRTAAANAKGGKDWLANERNLDTVAEVIADSGCEVFVADLWKRCLKDTSPEAEEEALYRQQAITEELNVHTILLQQQRLKDIEQRADKRPTREGIKGSAAWVEVADNIIGTHRPAQWKRMEDDRLELIILKQRYGVWPLAVEFEWDSDRGSITGGRSIAYDPVAVEGADAFQEAAGMVAGRSRGRGGKKKWD